MATFSALATQIVQAAGRTDKQALIETLLNDERRAICREHNHYFMEEVVGRMLVVDQHKYALPSDFKDWGEVVCLRHNGDVRPGGLVEALSDNAGDTTQTLTITFLDYVGDLRTEAHLLTGVTPVSFSGGMAQIKKIAFSASTLGTITIRKSPGGATLTFTSGTVPSTIYPVSLDEIPLEGPRSEPYCLSHFGLLDTGDPEMFSDDRGELRVWPPIPDEADRWSLRLRYYKYLPDLSGSQTDEMTNRWPELLVARTLVTFYSRLPNGSKEADEHRKKVKDPMLGMPALIRMSNSRRLAELSSNLRDRQLHRRTGRSVWGYPFWGKR